MWPKLIAPPMYENAATDWIDPELPDIEIIWKAAREVGYAVGIHGSLKRDFDLIAVPWTNEAVSYKLLIEHLCNILNARTIGEIEFKPNSRVAVIIQVDGWYKNIDLSIVPALDF